MNKDQIMLSKLCDEIITEEISYKYLRTEITHHAHEIAKAVILLKELTARMSESTKDPITNKGMCHDWLDDIQGHLEYLIKKADTDARVCSDDRKASQWRGEQRHAEKYK